MGMPRIKATFVGIATHVSRREEGEGGGPREFVVGTQRSTPVIRLCVRTGGQTHHTCVVCTP